MLDLDEIKRDMDESAGGSVIGWRRWRDHTYALVAEVERLRREAGRLRRTLEAVGDGLCAKVGVINTALAPPAGTGGG